MGKDQKPPVPKEAQVVAAILKDMNVTNYEPAVVNQILEFIYRYTSQILDDSRALANYAKKNKNIEVDDVKLAIQMHVDRSFALPPPRDLLLDLARQRNSTPLPAIKAQCGLRLPPDRYCVTATNYRQMKQRTTAKGGVSILLGSHKTPNHKPSGQTLLKVKTAVSRTPTVRVSQGLNTPKFQAVPAINIKTEDGASPGPIAIKRKRED